MTARPRQRPEALAQFAETARNDRREDRPGLVADEATKPLPTDSAAKDEAATKVLQEGATGADHGAEEAIDRLPDRILESRHAAPAEGEQDEPEPNVSDRAPNAQLTEGEEDIDLDEADIDVTLEEDVLSSHDDMDDDEIEKN